jgi:hypothetical protein
MGCYAETSSAAWRERLPSPRAARHHNAISWDTCPLLLAACVQMETKSLFVWDNSMISLEIQLMTSQSLTMRSWVSDPTYLDVDLIFTS